MTSRPRLRRYATAAGSCAGLRSSTRSALATDRPAHSVAHHDVAIGKRFLQRAHRGVSADFAECHRRTRAKLAILASAKYATCIQDVGEHLNALVPAQHPVRLEERHLLGERGIAERLRPNVRLDAAQCALMPARAENFHSCHADVAVFISE